MEAKLILENQTEITGESFGASRPACGEVVFSTAMTGYVEALTDPSYSGQILVFTYPLIGNYGVPSPQFFQSPQIQVAGLIVSQLCPHPSHYQSQKNLDQWLKENNVPALSGIDTRALTQKIRQKGTMLGKIIPASFPQNKTKFHDPHKENLVAKVSTKKIRFCHQAKYQKTIVLIDCGVKKAIIDALLKRHLNVIRIPWDDNPLRDSSLPPFAGVVISNGPGNPLQAQKTIENTRELLKRKVPILGICLGHQILALAAGAKTYKLKFGHRSLNQPVKNLENNRCFITSQNHGFAVDKKTLPPQWKEWFINLHDQTCEGIKSQNGLFLGSQFHPEGYPGPEDTDFIFDEFAKTINRIRHI